MAWLAKFSFWLYQCRIAPSPTAVGRISREATPARALYVLQQGIYASGRLSTALKLAKSRIMVCYLIHILGDHFWRF